MEIVDFSSQETVCHDLTEFPLNISEQIGGFYDFNTPILCGGWNRQVSLLFQMADWIIRFCLSFEFWMIKR